jgi:hypothetical protein
VRLKWRPPTPAQRQAIQAALEDAHADVEAYLGQPVTPTQTSETGLFPVGGGWLLTKEPVVRLLSATPETDLSGWPTGTFTVTYLWGLDAAADPELAPIRRYIAWAAQNDPAVVSLWQEGQPDKGRVVQSAATEGQTVTYRYRTPTSVAATAGQQEPKPPKLEDLDRWRVAGRRVFQRPDTWDGYYGAHPDGTGYRHGWYGWPPP